MEARRSSYQRNSGKAALVQCGGCNADIATKAVFKARTTMIILAEDQEDGKDLLGPDPLDVMCFEPTGAERGDRSHTKKGRCCQRPEV